jgi:hypothetical protein
MTRMTSFEFKRTQARRRASRIAVAALVVAGCAASTACVAPNTTVHRVSVDVQAQPKDLRACVAEAIRGIDGVPGLNPPPQGIDESVVAFRTTLPEVTGVVEREGADGVRVSFEVMAFVEPSNFWEFAQSRAKAIGDAIVVRCGAL